MTQETWLFLQPGAGFSWGSSLRFGHPLSLQGEGICMWHYKHQAWSQSHGPVLWKASTSRLLTNTDILGTGQYRERFTGINRYWEQYMTFPMQLKRTENCLLMSSGWKTVGFFSLCLQNIPPLEYNASVGKWYWFIFYFSKTTWGKDWLIIREMLHLASFDRYQLLYGRFPPRRRPDTMPSVFHRWSRFILSVTS